MKMLPKSFFFAGIMLLLGIFPEFVVADEEPPVLDEGVMKLSVESAKLCSLTYLNATQFVSGPGANGILQYEHPDYEDIYFYNDEPDQAIVAKKDGRCYVAFRGTTRSLGEWRQNLGLGSIILFKDNNETTGESCRGRRRFGDFVTSDQFEQGAADLKACAATCSDPDDCVILTGHSQGGSSAMLAMILLHRFNPKLITFGQPRTVTNGCGLIRSERVYRYVNSMVLDGDYIYDPISLLLNVNAFRPRGHYGYYLLLGEDTTAVKFLGVDEERSGLRTGLQISLIPHDMQTEWPPGSGTIRPWSYESRMVALFENGTFPVVVDGFSGGVRCDPENDIVCSSEDCGDEFLCVAATGSNSTEAPVSAPTTPPQTDPPSPSESTGVLNITPSPIDPPSPTTPPSTDPPSPTESTGVLSITPSPIEPPSPTTPPSTNPPSPMETSGVLNTSIPRVGFSVSVLGLGLHLLVLA